jgi:hypothetical protein
MHQGEALARFFRMLAIAVEKKDEKHLSEYLDRLEKFVFNEPKRTSGSHRDSKLPDKDRKAVERNPAALLSIYEAMRQSANREEAFAKLEKESLTRNDMARMAKLNSVHVTKNDNVGLIREKLVHSAIGSRLNSRAIRGE